MLPKGLDKNEPLVVILDSGGIILAYLKQDYTKDEFISKCKEIVGCYA
jgi:hypothetical protein